jgi:hypothetical protein
MTIEEKTDIIEYGVKEEGSMMGIDQLHTILKNWRCESCPKVSVEVDDLGWGAAN